MMRAAAIASSRARLPGCLPWACDRTTVKRGRLIRDAPRRGSPGFFSNLQSAISNLQSHMTLQGLLRLLPVRIEELVILGRSQQAGGVALHLEQPAGTVV